MGAVRIQTGGKEPIEIIAVDAFNQPLTGLSNLKVRIRRIKNGAAHFDWTDNTFKISPLQLLTPLTEIDPSKCPGEYRLNTPDHVRGFDTSKITNPQSNDTYRITVVQEGSPQNVANVPQIGEITVGDWVDYIDAFISQTASLDGVRDIIREFGLDHLVAINPGIVPPAANTYIRQIIDKLDAITPEVSSHRTEHSYAYEIAADILVGQIWVEARNGVEINVTSCAVTWYDENGTAMFTVTDSAPDTQGVFRVAKVAPGLAKNKSYYAIASVDVVGIGTVRSAKGSFTVG